MPASNRPVRKRLVMTDEVARVQLASELGEIKPLRRHQRRRVACGVSPPPKSQ